MAVHASRRLAALLAILLALGGLALLIIATDQVDQAAMLAAIGLVCLSVAVYVAAALPAPPSTDDVFESIAWGKFFVAATYAALAIALFAATTHAPGYARLLHML